MPQMDHLVADT